jgi:hypothetical protein
MPLRFKSAKIIIFALLVFDILGIVLPLRGLCILKKVCGRKFFEEIQIVMKSEKTQQLYYKMGLN